MNQRFDLAETRITTLESAATSAAAKQTSTAPATAAVSSGAIADVHNSRISNYDPTKFAGVLFVETDRNDLIYQSQYYNAVLQWMYVGGTYKRTQSQLAALAATLGAVDTGLRVEVTDYVHILRWTGSAWEYAPEDDHRAGEGPIFREVDPGTGWHLYNGATVAYLKADGTTANVTLRDFTTPAFIEGALANAAIAAAVAPTTGGTLTVAAAPTGVTATGPGTTASSAPGTSGPSATVNVTTSGATSVASGGHTHNVNSHAHTVGDPTISDPTHTHTLSGSLSINANGTPRAAACKAWFRQ